MSVLLPALGLPSMATYPAHALYALDRCPGMQGREVAVIWHVIMMRH